MKNTAIEKFCDWGMVFSLCALIFVLPVSIALLDSFAGLTIFFYFLKKINRMCLDWPVSTSQMNLLSKIRFIWKSFSPPDNFLNRPLQFLSLAVFISVIFSQYPALSLAAFVGKFLKCIFLYFSFIEAFSDEKRIRIFLALFMLSAFVTILSGIVQYCQGHDFLKRHSFAGGRINASFFTANGFGAYLLPVIGLVACLSFAAIVRQRSWILGGVLILFLVLSLTCLCWTYSRSSWVGFLAIIFVMFLLDRRKALLAGALLLVFILTFLPSLHYVRHLHLINDINSDQNENTPFNLKPLLRQGGSGRHDFWKKAISIIRSSPVYGTGLNTYSRVIKRDHNLAEQWYAHNSYLQMTAETGLLGLACFLWMLFVLLRYGLVYCKQFEDYWPLTYLQGSVAGLFGYLIQSFFDNTFYSVQLSVLLWTLIGLMVAITRLKLTREGA